jgi:hypothetical protein
VEKVEKRFSKSSDAFLLTLIHRSYMRKSVQCVSDAADGLAASIEVLKPYASVTKSLVVYLCVATSVYKLQCKINSC